MIGVDTNILVYAHRKEMPEHKKAFAFLKDLAEGRSGWALTWTSIYEFLRVVTHPNIFKPPTKTNVALDFIEHLLECPSLTILKHEEQHFITLKNVTHKAQVVGNHFFDCHIATQMINSGVDTFYTHDIDFRRYDNFFKVRDPL